ncbi:serine/threonine-protein kinase HipA [Marinobacterium lutimaris]|uniref:Serine/threonine-protein kinase HipA n=1 Tax=Marinobacterium lutimaris TaxID=568106 RepID=A0A1H6DV48_9GAMM|nr:serine/threonine-protein kinase HipA [Marinobacterium lutimaris]
MDRKVNVLQNGVLAGVLIQHESGAYTFQYDATYLAHGAPIAYRLPLQKEAYHSDQLFPFFENLASEGWLLKLQSQLQHIDERDTFSMLIANGKDLVGAVSLEEIVE